MLHKNIFIFKKVVLDISLCSTSYKISYDVDTTNCVIIKVFFAN